MSKLKENYADEGLLNTIEMSQLLGISKRTLLEWVEQRAVPVLRINKTIRFQSAKVFEAINIKQSTKHRKIKNGK